jgi:hypothetical protein
MAYMKFTWLELVSNWMYDVEVYNGGLLVDAQLDDDMALYSG